MKGENRMLSRKTLVIITIVLVFGIMLISCNRGESSMSVPEGVKVGDIMLEPYEFKTTSGSYNAERGSLIVLENWNKDTSRLIALPIIRIHAITDKSTEPIFYLGGGPGSSNMVFKPSVALLANHDVVMVGYRGADGSVILDCPEVKKAMKGLGKDLLSKESVINLGKAFQKSFERLQAEGVDLDCYTMVDVVQDMEAARKALGYNRINLISESYGTRVAQIYAYQHPDTIFRSAMIGVNPPGCFVWEPEIIDHQLEYYAQLWAKDPECIIRTPNLAQSIRNVAHNMPSHWLFFPINPGKVKAVTFGMLSGRNSAAMVFDAYIAAEQGDASGLALMSLAYDLVSPSSAIWGDFCTKAVSADFDPNRDYFTEMEPPGSILGAPSSKLSWGCAQYSQLLIKSIPEEFRKVQDCDVETLLVSGSVDFATPAENATNQLLPHLTKGKQVILAEMGHCGDLWNVQPEAFERLLTSFYDTGVADDSLFTYAPMEFSVTWGFPRIIKIALILILLIVLGVIWLVRFIIRRIQRHKVRQTT